jgi:hypothetical protein
VPSSASTNNSANASSLPAISAKTGPHNKGSTSTRREDPSEKLSSIVRADPARAPRSLAVVVSVASSC